MSAPLVASRVDAAGAPNLPLSRLRALLLQGLAKESEQAAAARATMSALTGQTDVDSVLAREIAEAAASRADDAIADVEQALLRLDNGTYGVCEQCDVTIPRERLEAIPYARRCVNCSGLRSRRVG